MALTFDSVDKYATKCGYTIEKKSKGYLLNGVQVPTLARIVEIIKDGDLLDGDASEIRIKEQVTIEYNDNTEAYDLLNSEGCVIESFNSQYNAELFVERNDTYCIKKIYGGYDNLPAKAELQPLKWRKIDSFYDAAICTEGEDPYYAYHVQILKEGNFWIISGNDHEYQDFLALDPDLPKEGFKTLKDAKAYLEDWAEYFVDCQEQETEETMVNTENTTEKTLYIVRGCPGDGKTTLAKMITDCSVAADDMPGLYENGVYQQHRQKESHEWCKNRVETMMKNSITQIAVHNTFTRLFYYKPYIDMAHSYGYSVHIITSEAVLTPHERTGNAHNVPGDVLISMRNGFETFNPAPKLGITSNNIYEQFEKAYIGYPDVIIWDMDGTIKQTRSGATFPQNPDDIELCKLFTDLKDSYIGENCYNFIVSNQRGISGGQKTEEFLAGEIEYLLKEFETQTANDFYPQGIVCCTGKELWVDDGNFNKKVPGKAKPSPDALKYILENFDFDKVVESIWIIGDAHTDERSEDWQFAQNCQKVYPHLNIVYLPVQLVKFVRDAW